MNSVDFYVEELTHDINPEHFNHHENFIPYMHDEKISSFGDWMWNNGYNVGLVNLQTKVNSYCVPQWISVEDRLPEGKINPITQNFVEVLCATTFGDVRVYGYGAPQKWDEAHFWHGFGIMDEYVTHWMPLPEPPKENVECK